MDAFHSTRKLEHQNKLTQCYTNTPFIYVFQIRPRLESSTLRHGKISDISLFSQALLRFMGHEAT